MFGDSEGNCGITNGGTTDYNLEMLYRSLSITYKGISERGIEADY